MQTATEPRPPIPTLEDLSSLITAARAGSAEARGLAIQACWNYLIQVARSELATDLQPRAGASDLVQETFLYANKAFDQFQGRDQKQLQAWIRQILLYRISQFRRGQRSLTRSPQREVRVENWRAPEAGIPADSDLSSCTKLIREEQLARLRCAINSLKPHHRELVILRGLEQRSFDDIALRLGSTPGAVSRAWTRAAQRLCEAYNRLGGSSSSIANLF